MSGEHESGGPGVGKRGRGGGDGEGPPTRVLDSLGGHVLILRCKAEETGVGNEGLGWGVAARDPPLES